MFKQIIISYLKFIGKEAGFKREKEVRRLLPKGKNLRYLDCGCEDGRLTLERANVIGTNKVYGIEIMDSEIKKARQRGVIVENADLNDKIPFGNNEFDVITATQVIEHLYNIDNFVSEIRRLLKPEGIFIVSTENLAAWHNIFALVLGMQPSTGPFISNKFTIGFYPLNKEHVKDQKIAPHLADMNGHTRVMTYNSCKELYKRYNFKLLVEKTLGYYPFFGFFADIFSGIDKWHGLNIILKLEKI